MSSQGAAADGAGCNGAGCNGGVGITSQNLAVDKAIGDNRAAGTAHPHDLRHHNQRPTVQKKELSEKETTQQEVEDRRLALKVEQRKVESGEQRNASKAEREAQKLEKAVSVRCDERKKERTKEGWEEGKVVCALCLECCWM